MINAILNMLGLNKIWAMLDGLKGYITGVITIMTGACGLLNEWLNATGGHDFKALIAFMQTVPKDSNWMMILAGFGVISAAHKADKIIEAGNVPVAPSAPAPILLAPAPTPAPENNVQPPAA